MMMLIKHKELHNKLPHATTLRVEVFVLNNSINI